MNKAGLIILDGWGLGKKDHSDAIYNANTPNFDALWVNYPHATLKTSGLDVGLPEGQMGNSEVGHLNIGAGRIVYQELTRINKSIADGDFFENPVLIEAFETAKLLHKKVHLIGLVSEGGVHSSQEHLHALCDMAEQIGVQETYIHAFTDGRDCDPKSGRRFLLRLEDHIARKKIKIASVIGRYYAMDRDNRWERIAKAYHLLVHGQGQKTESIAQLFDTSYTSGISDEFIEPHVLNDGKIENGDVVIFFNFRTDRPRELTTALTQQTFPEHNMAPMDLHFVTMTQYDEKHKNIKVVFENDNLENTLGEVISKAGKSQIRIAETEKYPHVTFFFNGGREIPFAGETRIMVNSPKVATYDLQPEMSAFEVRDKLIAALQNQTPDFFCLNFANPDMVGHTGVYTAIVKAVETVDLCLGQIVETAKELGYEIIIIADHGNAEYAVNDDGSPNTAHSLNPVPIIHVTEKPNSSIRDGILADVAPTILKIMGIEQAEVMSGEQLLRKKTHTELFPSISTRVKALMIDNVVLILLMFLIAQTFDWIEPESESVRIAAFLLVFVLIEPILLSLFGATTGHFLVGIRVKRKKNQKKNMNFVLAIIRYIFKVTLGWLSLITIGPKTQGRAIHDLISGSIVIFKDDNTP